MAPSCTSFLCLYVFIKSPRPEKTNIYELFIIQNVLSKSAVPHNDSEHTGKVPRTDPAKLPRFAILKKCPLTLALVGGVGWTPMVFRK